MAATDSGTAACRIAVTNAERAGHDPYSEQPAEVMAAIRDFMSADAPTAWPAA